MNIKPLILSAALLASNAFGQTSFSVATTEYAVGSAIGSFTTCMISSANMLPLDPRKPAAQHADKLLELCHNMAFGFIRRAYPQAVYNAAAMEHFKDVASKVLLKTQEIIAVRYAKGEFE